MEKQTEGITVRELLDLQEKLKQDETCFSAEEIAIQNIKRKIENLIDRLQKMIVSNLSLNRSMESLNVLQLEKSMKENKPNNLGKVVFYQTLDCPLSTVQKNRYRRLLLLLRTNPFLIADSITKVIDLGKEEIDHITHSGLFSVYANICNDEEENNFLLLLKDCIENEFKNTKLQSDQFLSKNKILSRLLSAYTKSTTSYKFLVNSLRDVILEVIQNDDYDFNKKQKNEKENENIDESRLEKQQFAIICGKFFNSLYQKIPLMPYGIRWITHVIQDFCKKYDRESDKNLILGNFIFLRFLNPVIITPERYNIIPDIPILKHHRNNFLKIAKFLKSLCNGIETVKNNYQLIDEDLKNINLDVNKFFHEVGNIQERVIGMSFPSTTQLISTLLIDRKPKARNTFVSLNDLYSLHAFFGKYITDVVTKETNVPLEKKQLMNCIKDLGDIPDLVIDEENKYLSYSLNLSDQLFAMKENKLPKIKTRKRVNTLTGFRWSTFRNKKESPKGKGKENDKETGNGLEQNKDKQYDKDKNKNTENGKVNEKEKQKQKQNEKEKEKEKEERKTIKENEIKKEIRLINKENKLKKKNRIKLKKYNPKMKLKGWRMKNKKKNKKFNKFNSNNTTNLLEKRKNTNFEEIILKGEKLKGKEYDQLIEEGELKLRKTLCKINYLTGKKDDDLLEMLKREREAVHSSYSINVACLLDSTLLTLEKMPESIKKMNYRPLIYKLKKDYSKRRSDLQLLVKEKYQLQGIYNRLQELVNQAESRNLGFENFVKSLIARRFIETNFKKLEKLSNKIVNSQSLNEQKDKSLEFFDILDDLILQYPLVKVYINSTHTVLKIIHNEIFTKLFKQLFYPLFDIKTFKQNDLLFYEKILKIKPVITPNFLNVPTQVWKKDLWQLAIVELERVNNYKSPLLKIEALAKCARIVNNILLYNGIKEVGADLMLPIMIYITLTVNLINLPSNIRFIDHFCCRNLIDPEQEYWFTVFKSAFVYLNELDPNTITQSQSILK
ncbi:rab gdp/gtp exchange factor [Anaeramoeba flamelloides]|uniref:Rab gdp/gtp exchange factor n=1 Tax=Anaeramoeba flamelloides TaxID=1746091 RepID=A0ABQ8XFG2_9EUKA|nr:rab gdp/gtp exchange factor [Anaeramoeba flamelloides]